MNNNSVRPDIPKTSEYYENVRHDIAPLFPKKCKRVLEIGCGTGATLAHFKSKGHAEWISGVEPMEAPAQQAQDRLDKLWVGPIEGRMPDVEQEAQKNAFDVILCLDVLEHLVNPWEVTLKLVSNCLAPGGCLIASLPNIRYYKVVTDLLFRGKWTYDESGILDSTHLRFFTRKTMVELIEGAGLKITHIQPTTRLKPWKNKWIINKLSGGRLTELYAFNYLIRGQK